MVNLFEFISVILLFIVITECGAKQDVDENNEIDGRRSNKYFKFQPRKEDTEAVALFRTSVEQLPCAKNTELPMNPSDIGTEYQQNPDYADQTQSKPTDPPPTSYDDYYPSPVRPKSVHDDADNSEEAIDLNVNIVITNMPLDDEESEVDETEPTKHKTVHPQTKRTTKRPSNKPVAKPKPVKRPLIKPFPLPHKVTKHPKLKPRPHTYDYMLEKGKKDKTNEYRGDETTRSDDSVEEIDINVAVIVPDEDDNLDGNTIGEGHNYEDLDEVVDGVSKSWAARVRTNTLVGLVSFFCSIALTNFFFY